MIPVAFRPLAANDPRPYRAVYQTEGGARVAAQREARIASPVHLCERVGDLGNTEVWAAIDGDARMLLEQDMLVDGDWLVRSITQSEVTRRQQEHLRGQVAGFREEAEQCRAEAANRPETSAVRAELNRRAVELIDCARRLELKLLLSAVIDCEITSSDRDSREAASL